MSNRIYPIALLIGLTIVSFFVECTTSASACKDITSKSYELQLKTHLFCDYDTDVRPQSNKTNTTRIGMTIMPKIIEFDDSTNTLSVHCWTAMNWTDPFLTWDPADFGKLDSLNIHSSDIWTPDIKVHNSGDANDAQEFPEIDCNLFRDGSIICIPSIKYTAYCDSDYTNYPYDVQDCVLEFSSWSYSADEIDLHFSHGVVMSDYTPNQEWKILETPSSNETTEFKLNESSISNVYKIQFILQRRAAGMHIVYVAPAIVLMVLTLSVLWLDCHSMERMIVASISFICHLICIQDLYFSIPHNGAVSPNILRFYEASFLLMGLSLLLTVLLRELGSVKGRAPDWLASTTGLVLRSRPGQLLLLSILDPKASAFLEATADDNDDLVQRAAGPDSTWAYLTLMLGWLAFVAAFLAYALMLGLFLPSDTGSARPGV